MATRAVIPARPPHDDRPIRGQVRLVGHRRVTHGVHLREREGLPSEAEFRRDLQAWLLVLADDAVFTHVTAARLLGWRLPQLPEHVPIFAAVHGHERRPRRGGLICSSLVGEPPRRRPGDIPVDWPEEILLRAARDLGVLDLVIMIDSALQLGHLDPARVDAVLESKRPGVRRLRRAWELSDRRRESAGESLLGVLREVFDIPAEPQVDLFAEDGRHLGRADLLVTGTSFVHEYDGAVHRDKVQHRADLRRERGWSGSPYVRRGFTLDDLLNHPLVVMHELDRALGRPHRPGRLARWRTLVSESLYGEPGRARVMNRWRRALGVADWSTTASSGG